MSHREYRMTVHAICDDFYSQIRGLDGGQESWERVSQLRDEYCARCGDTPLCRELILAVVNEFERNLRKEG